MAIKKELPKTMHIAYQGRVFTCSILSYRCEVKKLLGTYFIPVTTDLGSTEFLVYIVTAYALNNFFPLQISNNLIWNSFLWLGKLQSLLNYLHLIVLPVEQDFFFFLILWSVSAYFLLTEFYIHRPSFSLLQEAACIWNSPCFLYSDFATLGCACWESSEILFRFQSLGAFQLACE